MVGDVIWVVGDGWGWLRGLVKPNIIAIRKLYITASSFGHNTFSPKEATTLCQT